MFCPNPDCPDLVEGGVQGEYVDGIGECPRCGAQLVPDSLPGDEASDFIDGDVEVESVFVTADRSEAAVVRSLLRSSGVPFTMDGTADQEFLGLGQAGVGITGRGGVSFSVRAEDVETARALLEEHVLIDDQEV